MPKLSTYLLIIKTLIPYYKIFILLATVALLDGFNIKWIQKNKILSVIVVLLTVFATLRYNIGFQDYDAYVSAYHDIVENGLNYSKYTTDAAIFEPGFVITYYISTFFSNNPIMGFFVIALLAVSLNLSSYQKYTKYFFVATLLYFVHTFALREMIQIRAGVAAAICLFSIRYVERRLLWRFCVTILIASSFHLASIVFLSVYWVYWRKWTKKIWIRIICLSLLVGIFMPLGRLLSNIPVSGIGARIATYTWMIGSDYSGIFNITFFKQFIFCAYSLLYWEKLNSKVPHFNIFFVCMSMSLCWLSLWRDFPIISNRMATFFSITEVLLLPSFIYLVRRRSIPIVIGIVVFYAFLTLWLNINVGNIILYQDYRTFPQIL